MKFRAALLIAPPALLLAAGIAAQTDGTVIVRNEMMNHVNPATLTIWDVGNAAMDEVGGIDPALMDDERWALLGEAAGWLDGSARRMAEAEVILAASPDNMPEGGEGEITMAQVQSYIDADPEGFRAAARELATYAGELASAAKARDAAQAGDVVARLDAVCESCHAPFWYPE